MQTRFARAKIAKTRAGLSITRFARNRESLRGAQLMKGGIEVIKEGYVSVFQGINVWITDEEHYEMKNEDDIYVIYREGEEYYMALKNN